MGRSNLPIAFFFVNWGGRNESFKDYSREAGVQSYDG